MVACAQEDTLYERPDLYDLVAPRDPILERFYVEMACERGGRVLDLACGTGRLTIPLAQAGLEVTGGDMSADMLQRARDRAEAQAIAADFFQLDMRDFDLGGSTFDTIIVAINSVMHLHSPGDFEGFFRCVGRHLSRNGRLVFDAFVPSIAMLGRDSGLRQSVGVVVHDTLGRRLRGGEPRPV